MRSLLYKELSIVPLTMLIFPPMLWVFCVLSDTGTSLYSTSAIMLGCYIMGLTDHRRKNKAALIMSLPITRGEVIFSKYIAAIIMGSSIIVVIFLVNSGVEILANRSYALPIYEIGIGFMIAIIIAIPIFSHPGLGMWPGALTYGALMGIFCGIFSVMNKEVTTFAMSIVLGGLLLISWSISHAIYKKSEF